jgi:hypothetical protein
MPYLGSTPNASFSSRTKQDFTANGTTTAFTLSSAVASANDIEVFVGNVRQEPTDAYTVSGATLTMSAAPTNGINFYVIFKGVEENSVVPADGTISSGKIANNAVTTAKIADNSISSAKFASTALDPITLDSSNNRVGVGVTSPQDHLHVVGTNGGKIRIGETSTRYTQIQGASSGSGLESDMIFYNTNSSGTPTVNLQIMGSGRGTSDFTVRAWINFNGTGTIAIRDSHNISSIVDGATGDYIVNFAASMPSTGYATGLGIGGAAVLIVSGRDGQSYNAVGSYRIGVRDGTSEAWTDTELVTAMWCGG